MISIQVKLFRGLIIEIARLSNYAKYFNKSIKIFLKNHFLSRQKDGNFSMPLNFLYEDAHIIFEHLKSIGEIAIISEVFSLMVNLIFDVNFKKLREENQLFYSFFDNIENVLYNYVIRL